MAESVIEPIQEVIDTYEGESGTMGIEALLDVQDQLVTLSWRLAEETAEAKTDYNWSYFTRKIEVKRAQQGMIMNQKMAVNQAAIVAETENKEKFEIEVRNESICYRLDLLLKQVNKILSAMQQRISYRKDEFKANQFANRNEP